MQRKLNLIELFSGIGSQAEALKNIGVDVNVVHTCEWNLHAFMAYALIHNMEGNADDIEMAKDEIVETLLNYGISNDGKSLITKTALQSFNEDALKKLLATIISTKNLVDISKVKGNELLGEIDVMTYSFPCQDLSNVGAFHGYNKGIDRDAGSRSGLLWEVERILFERRDNDFELPKFLLMENVPALNSPRHRKNFEEWQGQLEALGYYNKQFVLNAKDFGLPQNRERLLMLSVFTGDDKDTEALVEQFFTAREKDKSLKQCLRVKKRKPLKEFLKTDYLNEIYLKEALECQPNNTVSRQKILDENPKLTDKQGTVLDTVVSTLTTKQDRHPNSGNLYVPFDNGKAEFRYLTPRECFLLMGFKEEDYDNVLAGNFETKKRAKMFTRDNLIKMAGNSIAVNVLEAIFELVVDLYEKLWE